MTWKWELLAGPDTITEGPVWDGAALLYTAIEHDEIRCYDPATGEITTVLRDTHGANGLQMRPDGSLYACEGDGRAIVRYDPRGRREVLADRFAGRRLNSPNDLALDDAGRIWFTDPRYRADQAPRELDHDSVYRLDPPRPDAIDGVWSITRVTFDTTRPNGILLSADGASLYVAQSDYDAGSVRQLRSYPIRPDGSLGEMTVLHDFGEARGIDGMCLDVGGNVVATCGWEVSGPGSRIAVFAPDGTVLEEHPLPDGRPSNCAFGGMTLEDLYVTTLDGRLYRAFSGRRGFDLRAPRSPLQQKVQQNVGGRSPG